MYWFFIWDFRKIDSTRPLERYMTQLWTLSSLDNASCRFRPPLLRALRVYRTAPFVPITKNERMRSETNKQRIISIIMEKLTETQRPVWGVTWHLFRWPSCQVACFVVCGESPFAMSTKSYASLLIIWRVWCPNWQRNKVYRGSWGWKKSYRPGENTHWPRVKQPLLSVWHQRRPTGCTYPRQSMRTIIMC